MIQDKRIIDLLNENSKLRSEALYKSKQNKTKGKGLLNKCLKDYQ